jgi:hypothetical protein
MDAELLAANKAKLAERFANTQIGGKGIHYYPSQPNISHS